MSSDPARPETAIYVPATFTNNTALRTTKYITSPVYVDPDSSACTNTLAIPAVFSVPAVMIPYPVDIYPSTCPTSHSSAISVPTILRTSRQPTTPVSIGHGLPSRLPTTAFSPAEFSNTAHSTDPKLPTSAVVVSRAPPHRPMYNQVSPNRSTLNFHTDSNRQSTHSTLSLY